MTEETQDSIITGRDEVIVHRASQMPGLIDTTLTGSLAIGGLARRHSKTPTLTFVSKEVLNQFAGHLGGVLGRFSQRVAKSQKSMYLDVGQLSTQGQQQAREVGKVQCQVEQGESIFVEALDMFGLTIKMLDQESKNIQAEIVARVQADFQTQQARQEEQAEYSQ